jgi:predicted Zn-dependent protease
MANRLQTLLQFLEESPGDAFLQFALAKEYEGQQQDDDALAAYLRLRAQHPDYVGLYYHLGKLYERRQATQSAWDTYTEGMATATRLGDRHALSELAGARLGLDVDD